MVKFGLACGVLVTVAFALFQWRWNAATQRDSISGLWSDACPCHVPCMCWRTNRSSSSNCFNVNLYRITRDESLTANLRGSQFVVIESSDTPYAAPFPQTVFVDSSASPDQVSIITALAAKYFAHAKVIRQPMVYRENGNNQQLEIPNVLSYNIQISEARPKNDVSDFLYHWLTNPRQGIVTKVWYGPPGEQSIEYSGTNALKGEFHMLRPSPSRKGEGR
jgi:hypothetical protein